MGYTDGKIKGSVALYGPTLHRVLNDMAGFKAKVADDPGHMKIIRRGIQDLYDEGNGQIAYHIDRTMEVAEGAPAKEPWALGDDDLKKAVEYYNEWLGDEEPSPALKLKKMNNPEEAKKPLAIFPNPAVVFITSITSKLRKARNKAMIELSRRGLSMD